MHLTSEDTASIVLVLGVLEQEVLNLGPASMVAGVWTDWADALRPTMVEATTVGPVGA
jgi:hypothetical protein